MALAGKLVIWGVLYCHSCGTANPDGSTYCTGCGKMLNP